MISVISSSDDWAIALGDVADRYRDKAFSYGDILRFGCKISGDSAMDGFLLFSPLVMDKEQSRIVLPDRVINMVQAYPIYESEIDLIQAQGPADFCFREDIDFLDLNRRSATSP